VLLHGFPEFWWCWRRQIPALVAAGYRAVVPDQRGYHFSSKPRRLGAYRLDRLAADLGALLVDLGPGAHPVVAHDWGGVTAWWGALLFADQVAGLAVLNAPHPTAFRRALLHDADQRRRSRYIFYFQLPWFPERRLAREGFRAVRSMLRRLSRPDTFSAADLDRYAAAIAVPGALHGSLAWYRAAARRPPPRPPSLTVEPPVRLIWGLDDAALGPALLDSSARFCRRPEVVRLAGAGHWLQHEEPDEVNRQLLDFLASEPVRSRWRGA